MLASFSVDMSGFYFSAGRQCRMDWYKVLSVVITMADSYETFSYSCV